MRRDTASRPRSQASKDAARPPMSETLLRGWQLLEVVPSDPPGLTALELLDRCRQEFNWQIDIRTVHRYLAALSEIGHVQPVHADLPPNIARRWILAPARSRQRNRMDTGQAIAYLLLERIASSLLPDEITASIQTDFLRAREHARIRGRADKRLTWTAKVDFLPDSLRRISPPLDSTVLKVLQTALLEERQVECAYLSRDTKSRERNPKPKRHVLEIRGLVQRGLVLYAVVTYPGTLKAARAYPVRRFVSARLLDEPIDRRSESLQTFLESGVLEFNSAQGTINLRAKIDEDQWVTLLEAPLSEDQELRRSRTGLFVSATVLDSRMLESYLLSHCGKITVLEPQDLRNRLIAKLRAGTQAYAAAEQ